MTDGQRQVNRAWRQYTIMHLDRRVASIRSDGACAIYAASFMPYNLYLEQTEEMDARVNNLNSFYYWCASRVLTLDRKYAKEILNSIGARQATTDRERAAISLAYHCVTLTDVYWVKGYREQIAYDEINLFDHSLSDAFVDVSLRGKALTAQNAELIAKSDTAGDVTTQGAAPKAWVRRDGMFFLLKDGDEKEVDAELLASRIARCFDADQVLYEPFLYDGQKVSASRLMTSKDFAIVPMEHVEIYAANPHEIDLVLLDMIMPKAGGHQTFFKIRAIDPEAKILLSSGFVSENEVQDLLAQGACGFLPKPHRLPVVAQAIREILDRGKNDAK